LVESAQGLPGEDGRSSIAAPRVSQAPQAVSWLLDSDVLSQPAKKVGDPRVIKWIEKHQSQCYTSSIVIAQLAFWVRTKRARQRVALQKWLTELVEAMHGRILGFNVSVAHVWADQQYLLQAAGKPMPIEDSYIAAIARRHNLTIATGNVKDFQRPGIKVFDPFAES
jgi:toxin FitB